MEEVVIFVALVVGALTVVLPVVVVVMVAIMKGTLGDLVSKVDELRFEVARLKRRSSEEPAESKTTVPSPSTSSVPSPASSAVKRATPPVSTPAPVSPTPPPVPASPPRPSHAFTTVTVQSSAPVSAPAPRPQPAAPSAFQESVQQILAEIWSWILVGEKHRRHNVSAEFAIASTWLLRISIIIFVTGIGFFLKWSIDRQMIGPMGRVALSLLTGVAMLVGGMQMLKNKYNPIGQGLMGGGILALYFSMYAAGPDMLAVVSQPTALALMVLVTVTAAVVAIFADSLLVAVLGLVGGFGTPVLLQTEHPSLFALYSYMLLLLLGMLAIARIKRWHLLNYLGLVGTYLLFTMSLSSYDKSEIWTALPFLMSFFFVHSALSYINNVRRAKASTSLDIAHLVANALLFGGLGYWLVRDAYGRPWPALLSLGTAFYFIGHVALFMRRQYVDRKLLIALIALAGGFTVWTLPLAMEKESLTIALALMALMFLWTGQRMQSGFVKLLSQVLYLVVLLRLVGFDMPRNFARTATIDAAQYWGAMGSRLVTYGLSIGSIFAGYLLQRREATEVVDGDDAGRVMPGNDVGVALPAARQAFYWLCVVLIFAFVYLELGTMLLLQPGFRPPGLTLLWCLLASYLLTESCKPRADRQAVFVAMCVVVAVALVKLLVVDLAVWRICEHFYYNTTYTLVGFTSRSIDFGALLAVLWVVWLQRRRADDPMSHVTPVFGYLALALLFLYSSLELNSLLHWKLSEFRSGGISILWAVFAISYLGSGIYFGVRGLRYLGLALFCVVVGKVFLHDLADLDKIYRVIAFLVVGVVMLAGSFAYIHASGKFELGGAGKDDAAGPEQDDKAEKEDGAACK
jgi:hypothetical protein